MHKNTGLSSPSDRVVKYYVIRLECDCAVREGSPVFACFP